MSKPKTSPSHSGKVLSLQKRLMSSTLISSILTGLLSLVILIGVVGYDMHELFDDILEENGKLWLEEQNSANAQMKYYLGEYNEELDLDYQLIDTKGQIQQKSGDAPRTVFIANAEDDRFYNIYHGQKWWRVYVKKRPDSLVQIQIAQPWQQRYEHLLPAIGHFSWLMLLLWIVLLTGNWLAIRRGLKTFTRISEQIAQKNVQNLSPIQPTEIYTELQPMIAAINALLLRLDQALQAEQRFTADAAHELRTPLSAIQMKLQLMQRRHKTLLEPIQPELEQLKQDVQRSTAVVENLLFLARLDPQQSQALPRAEFPLMSLLQDVWQNISAPAQQKNIELIQDWQIATDLTCIANRELCFTALRNLLDNAIRYSHVNGKVKFSVFSEHDQIVFQIQDNGRGVDQDQLARLTQRFYRVLGTEQQGSGLGLSIVQHIVALHHGNLDFIEGLDNTGFGVRMALARHMD